ncbi:hypothetical protein P154DRAFT_579533 [Amniculicola lignicola CBS 123094]|uniref:Uncharacterized protein n=1 Tax=Amniculicola lignicola CBS 123094 TaxID=1392246 RepID=A0A6A5WGG2_9PLEO|nr:hypothetical protein P154DRAFT_579533 [Amniculicola lignicola CBS 123094]
MSALVFATCDLTPENWSDFAKSAAIPAEITLGEPIAPFTLVHTRSPTETELATETGLTIPGPIKTEFLDALWEDIKPYFLKFTELEDHLHVSYVLMLDEQSKTDRKVVILHQTLEQYARSDGTEVNDPYYQEEYTITLTVWKQHRVPYDKAFWIYSLMDDDGPEKEPYLEQVYKEPANKAPVSSLYWLQAGD